jgi:hypothetical protein
VPDLIGAELLSIYRNKTTSSPFFLISKWKSNDRCNCCKR